MTATPAPRPLDLPAYIAGQPVQTDRRVKVHYPYTNELTGTASLVYPVDVELAILAALDGGEPPTRYRRSEILDNARRMLAERAEEFADLIRRESGLCVRETRYEVGRALDVLRFAAAEALRDDGAAFAGDVSPHG